MEFVSKEYHCVNLTFFKKYELLQLQVVANENGIVFSRQTTSQNQATMETCSQNVRDVASYSMPQLTPIGTFKSKRKALGMKIL
jgi:hypothetical protein